MWPTLRNCSPAPAWTCYPLTSPSTTSMLRVRSWELMQCQKMRVTRAWNNCQSAWSTFVISSGRFCAGNCRLFTLLCFRIVSFIGVGSGMGGHVLARLGKRRPRLVEALILFNTDNQAPGWIEWARNLSTVKSLTRVSSMPVSVVDSLLNYHLGSSGKTVSQ